MIQRLRHLTLRSCPVTDTIVTRICTTVQDTRLSDNEFRALQDYYSPLPVHTTAAGEHNGVIERSIRTIEERARCHCHSTPFPKVPHMMMEHLLHCIIFSLNSFPTKTGISQSLSPSSIVLGVPSINYSDVAYHMDHTAKYIRPLITPCANDPPVLLPFAHPMREVVFILCH